MVVGRIIHRENPGRYHMRVFLSDFLPGVQLSTQGKGISQTKVQGTYCRNLIAGFSFQLHFKKGAVLPQSNQQPVYVRDKRQWCPYRVCVMFFLGECGPTSPCEEENHKKCSFH